MVSFKHRGDFKNTKRFFKKASTVNYKNILDKYAQRGAAALRENTPVDSGLTASSWGYEIEVKNGLVSIAWTNTNVIDGLPVAILLQYGHGTRNGGYIQGRDYINPALKPVFDDISEAVWREVSGI